MKMPFTDEEIIVTVMLFRDEVIIFAVIMFFVIVHCIMAFIAYG
jgi:hypothetical protein